MKKNNEIKANDTVRFIKFDNLEKAITEVTNGVDYLSDEQANLTTIPNRINHSTYGISRLVKPFTMVAEKSCPTAANYLFELTDSINSLDAGMLARDERYTIIKILHPAFIMIHNDLNKVLCVNNIKGSKLFELYEANMQQVIDFAYRVICNVFHPSALESIEQMMSLYSSFDDSKDKPFDMRIPYTLVSPFVNEAVMKILYDLYNYAVELLAKITIHDSIHTGTPYVLDELEAELEDTFITIHDDLISKISYIAVEWILCRTPQDIAPELKD